MSGTPHRRCAGVALLAVCVFACDRGGTTGTPDGGAGVHDAGAANIAHAVAIAEDTRALSSIPPEASASADPAIRLAAARAVARIGTEASHATARELLADRSLEVVRFAAFGLGRTCAKHEDETTHALVARLLSLHGDATKPGELARMAIVRAVGKCGAARADELLLGWMRSHDPAIRGSAALAFGDIAAKKKLSRAVALSLVEAWKPNARGERETKALYAISRAREIESGACEALVTALDANDTGLDAEAREIATSALGKCPAEGADRLAARVVDEHAGDVERLIAARSLVRIENLSMAARRRALHTLADRTWDDTAWKSVRPLLVAALLEDWRGDAAGGDARMLRKLTGLPLGKRRAQQIRAARIRCPAGRILANAAFDADVLDQCADRSSRPWGEARLEAIARRRIVLEREKAWEKLTAHTSPLVRAKAIELVGEHAELGHRAHPILVRALGDASDAVATAAANVVFAHPERIMVPTRGARERAADPDAPPPTERAESEPAPAIAKALSAALAKKHKEDQIELLVKLLEASTSLGMPDGIRRAKELCSDPNATLRDAALRALHSAAPDAKCPGPPRRGAHAKELEHPRVTTAHVELRTTAGTLTLELDPTYAPITVTRWTDLARAGFFDGQTIHRVVPGFVVQFGDPAGDGQGGSGKLLRSENSPVEFTPLSVGVALAGPDTGSSQIFVTLTRTAHLDGEYPWIGRASGPFARVSQDDIIDKVIILK